MFPIPVRSPGLQPVRALANTTTRLQAMDGRLRDRLINRGYALRAHVDKTLPKGTLPYPCQFNRRASMGLPREVEPFTWN